MASTPGQIRPWRHLAAFVAVVGALYGLVFFTGDGNPLPKLGIDLQGGTRVTLQPRTETGAEPVTELLMIPATLKRFVRLPGDGVRFIAIDSVILAHFGLLFPGFRKVAAGAFRRPAREPDRDEGRVPAPLVRVEGARRDGVGAGPVGRQHAYGRFTEIVDRGGGDRGGAGRLGT